MKSLRSVFNVPSSLGSVPVSSLLDAFNLSLVVVLDVGVSCLPSMKHRLILAYQETKNGQLWVPAFHSAGSRASSALLRNNTKAVDERE